MDAAAAAMVFDAAVGATNTTGSGKECGILGGAFGYTIQLSLGVVAVSTLLIKWRLEKPRRDFLTWFRDASKQALSALVAHGWNVLFAELLKNSGGSDPCVFYFVNYLIDNVIGVGFNYLLVKASESLGRKLGTRWLESGWYGTDGASMKIWLFQLAVWVLIISVVKWGLLALLIVPLKDSLYDIGTHMLGKVRKHPKVELVLVMIIVPTIINIASFLIQDAFLKFDKEEDGDESSPLSLPGQGETSATADGGGGGGAYHSLDTAE